MNRANKQGGALITALFVVALVSAATVAMLTQQQIHIAETILIQDVNRSFLQAQGAEYWAIDTLLENAKQQKKDQLIDLFPLLYDDGKKTKLFEGNGYFTAEIIDMQSKFNVNNLVDTKYHAGFTHMLHVLDPSLREPEKITQLISAWITPLTKETMDLDERYRQLKLPYPVPHRPMVSISELRLVAGITAILYNTLLPYVTALPTTTPININTAPALVLVSLDPKLDIQTAQDLVRAREKTPFITIEQFFNDPILKTTPIQNNKQITTTSRYFLSVTTIHLDEQQTDVYTLVERGGNQKQPTINVLWQSQGGL